MDHGGAGPVIQEPVDTGDHHLDKAINKFYNCLSHTRIIYNIGKIREKINSCRLNLSKYRSFYWIFHY
jgi:hypothetical protein